MAKRKRRVNVALDTDVNMYVKSVLAYEQLERAFSRTAEKLSELGEEMMKRGQMTQAYLNRLTQAQRVMAWTILHKAK